MIYHYLYKITNTLVTDVHYNFVYYGIHSTDNLNDGYMGSGKFIKKDIERLGRDYFSKEILEYFNSNDEARIREYTIVTKDYLKESKNSYNLAVGGGNTNHGVMRGENNHFYNKKHSEETRILLSELARNRVISPETKSKIGKTIANKRWYNNGITNIYIDKDMAPPEGFTPGMKKIRKEE